ncbi:MAG: hypothetical protein C4B58_04780 [Deltaproteobacteria bacterium]|nr:MAG: hypothetical protein C4B58_04780 [Deltaproteobacteria bacterium]
MWIKFILLVFLLFGAVFLFFLLFWAVCLIHIFLKVNDLWNKLRLWRWAHWPIFLLFVAVFLFGVFFTATLSICDFFNNSEIWQYFWIVLAWSVTSCFAGYLWLPAGLITFNLKDSKINAERVMILVDGRKISLKITDFPLQIKVYFQKAGEYHVFVFKDIAVSTKTNGKSIDGTKSPKVGEGTLNLYDGPLDSVEIEIG